VTPGAGGVRCVRAGYQGLVDEITEKPKELVEEAERGRSERTPWIVLGGVNVVVFGAVAVLLAIAFTAYYLAK
jgi:hypothetical protein